MPAHNERGHSTSISLHSRPVPYAQVANRRGVSFELRPTGGTQGQWKPLTPRVFLAGGPEKREYLGKLGYPGNRLRSLPDQTNRRPREEP